MDHQEIKEAVKGDCPTLRMEHGFDTRLTNWINRGQDDIAKKTGCLHTILPIKTSPKIRRYQIPIGMKVVTDVHYDKEKLGKIYYDDFDFSSTSQGTPTEYAIKGNYVYIADAPDSAGILRLTGLKEKITKLVNDGDKTYITVKYPEVLILFVKWKAYGAKEKFIARAKDYERQYREALQEIIADDLDGDGLTIADWPAIARCL